MDDPIQRAQALLASADGLLVTAGAGIGVDSGLPDFRGDEGFWRAYPALAAEGTPFWRIASPDSFRRRPERGWGFYGHRLALYRRTVPHAGFALLQALGARLPRGLFVFTSNVDGQFQRAGFDAERIVECHGSIHHLQCLRPCGSAIWPADDFAPVTDDAHCLLLNPAPRCPRCGGLARPNILMFGDDGWIADRSTAQRSRLLRWLAGTRRPVVIELGAGTAIPSVRLLGEQVARDGLGLVRINPREPAVQHPADVAIAAGALAALTALAPPPADRASAANPP
ncbi:SIR2 family NAD-dependent protein deacylase [Derxia lacustris]|uniref:SIR2 family NAD-dependent protein deacylase n=1 Tax=Derxia lacustris TaxID=764842 RepID=UPI000A16F90C|nr:Sir2 family NAD-dependent protein deacetylase [Derxia lacustris]